MTIGQKIMYEKPYKAAITLIHNNDLLRVSNSELVIRKIIDNLETNKINCCYTKISFQPEVLFCTKLTAIARTYMYLYLEYKWSEYRGMEKWKIFLRIVFDAFRYSYGLIFRNFDSYLQKKSAIEISLTSKHIKAWENFIETDADFLIVCEDDIIIKKDSTMRISELINRSVKLSQPFYFDLAGGLQLDALRVEKLIHQKINNRIVFNHPVTNTTCCYTINREFVKIALKFIVERPYLRYIGADWLINSLFILARRNRLDIYCEHFDPTILSHGTFTGQYQSSISIKI